MRAVILIKLGISVINKVIEELKVIPHITKVMSLTGDYDVLAEIEVETSEELYEIFSERIDMIDGIILHPEVKEEGNKLYEKLFSRSDISIVKIFMRDVIENFNQLDEDIKINYRDNNKYIITFSEEMYRKFKEIKKFLKENLYNKRTVVDFDEKGKLIIEDLFDKYKSNCDELVKDLRKLNLMHFYEKRIISNPLLIVQTIFYQHELSLYDVFKFKKKI